MNCKSVIFLADDSVDREVLCQAGSTYQIVESFYGREACLMRNKCKSKETLPFLLISNVHTPRIISRQTLLSPKEYKVPSGIPAARHKSAEYNPTDTSYESGKYRLYYPTLLRATMPFGCSWPAFEYPNN